MIQQKVTKLLKKGRKLDGLVIPEVAHKQKLKRKKIKSLNNLLLALADPELAWLSSILPVNFKDCSDDDDQNNEDREHKELCECQEDDGGVKL